MSEYSSNLTATEQKELLVSLLSQRPKRIFPLSLPQQRLWFLDQLLPENPAYNLPFGLNLHGNLDPHSLRLSIRDLTMRHEILRTSFQTNAGYPVQVVAEDVLIEMPLIDLRGMPESDRQLEATKIATEEATLPFNLATSPLLRLKLIRLAPEEYLLLCVIHHIVCDGWSLEIFVRELAELYDQHSTGTRRSLVDLPIQYGDYAEWQREWIAGDFLAAQAQYWKEKLAGAPPLLDLPCDYPRPYERAYNGTSQTIGIPKEIVDSLEYFGRTRRATLFMVMLAAFKTLIHSYAGTSDILVGIPVAGRGRVEIEDLIGFFVNTLVLRTNLSGDPHFGDLLLQVREVALDAFAHADLPFEKLVEELNPPRTLSHSPVIQVMFSAVKARKSPRFGNVSVTPYTFSGHKSLFDLAVEFIEDTEDRWWLRIEYDTALFGYTRIARMLKDYLTLLQEVAEQPEIRLSRLTSLIQCDDGRSGNTQISVHQEANCTVAPHREMPRSRSKDKAEPYGALEQILVRIWERVLGVSEIEIYDDFFDLGGHSLLAAQLVSEVEKAVGRSIPVSALFRGSTIESFADIVRSRAEWSPDPLVMELNAGAHGLPLFAVVESGMDAIGYGLMARYLGPGRPFYKLQGHTSTCRIVPFSVEELRATAHQYVAALKTIQPKGPYFLMGMCNGTHIAEQMVIDLETQGFEVGFFAIVDTFVLQSSAIRWLMRLESLRLGRKRVSKLPFLAQIAHYRQVFKKPLRQMFLPETDLPNPWWDTWAEPDVHFQTQQFRAPIILFRRPNQPYLRVPQQPFFKMRDREMGWGFRSLSGVEICMVDIDKHIEMLREPAVQLIAEQLKRAFQRIENDRLS